MTTPPESGRTSANVRSQLDKKLRETFRDIIDGKTVKRAKHELLFSGVDVSNVFLQELEKKNFLPVTVEQVQCEPGERVPAFYVDGADAYFGWVFWEKFTELRLRKLFGSIVRNEKGDWEIQIPALPAGKQTHSSKIIYANLHQKLEMDIEHPVDL